MYIKFTYREVLNHPNGALETDTTAQALFGKLAQIHSLASAPLGEALEPGEYIVTPGNVGHHYNVDVFIHDAETAEMVFTLTAEFLPPAVDALARPVISADFD